MQFTIVITDPMKLAGITAARLAYNEALPEQYETVVVEDAETDAQGNIVQDAVTEQRAITPKPGSILTDAEYVQFVADNATASYGIQYKASIDKAMQDEAFAAKLAAAAAA